MVEAMKRRHLLVLAAILSLSLPLSGDVTKVPPTGGGITSLTSGSTAITGCQNKVVYGNNSNVLECEANLSYNSGTNILTIDGVVQNGSSSSWYNISGEGLYFNNNASFNNAHLKFNTTLTPDSIGLGVGALSNTIGVYEHSDEATDFQNGPCGTAACTDPNIVVHSHNTDTTQYAALGAFGIAGGGKKALPDTTATDVFRVAVASDTAVGGIVVFTDFASDGTIQQSLSGAMQFSAVAEGTTETCPSPTAVGTNLNAVTAGTLTCAFTCDTTPTNAVDIQFGCNPSLTLGTQTLTYFVILTGPGEIVPQ